MRFTVAATLKRLLAAQQRRQRSMATTSTLLATRSKCHRQELAHTKTTAVGRLRLPRLLLFNVCHSLPWGRLRLPPFFSKHKYQCIER